MSKKLYKATAQVEVYFWATAQTSADRQAEFFLREEAQNMLELDSLEEVQPGDTVAKNWETSYPYGDDPEYIQGIDSDRTVAQVAQDMNAKE